MIKRLFVYISICIIIPTITNADPNVATGGSAGNNNSSSSSGPSQGTYLASPPTLTNNQTQSILLDSSGNLKVDIAAGGTGGGIADGTYNTTFPSLTNGQTYSIQLDSNARLIMAPLQPGSNVIGGVTQSGGPWSSNITQWGSVNLGAPTAWGTAPSGNVPGVNANVLSLPAVQPVSNAPIQCKGGTGSVIMSLTATPEIVCASAGGSYTRTYWDVTNPTGTSTGALVAVCTDDGTTPSATNYRIGIFGGLSYNSGGDQNVSPLALQCVSLSGTIAIVAHAVQAGATP